jgi:hypothetical protein
MQRRKNTLTSDDMNVSLRHVCLHRFEMRHARSQEKKKRTNWFSLDVARDMFESHCLPIDVLC